jgi:hypothetical protein
LLLLLKSDPLPTIPNAAQRSSVIVRLDHAGATAPGALLGVFDIVLDI